MAQSIRQRNLFAAEDFTVVYDSFAQANFQAYDYDTIRSAMVDYIRDNYPENYNDWISSSEFVALLEMIAFMGHNLAFRVDLASRENFLSTAERRASVLRIADFLGYNPARALASRGVLKITSVKTTQNVYDVSGTSLKSKEIDFVNDLDSNSYQNFILIMNEIFASTNRFGKPSASKTISGIKTDVYNTNIADNQGIVFPFQAKVNGKNESFEIVNQYIDADDVLGEPNPTPDSSFNFIYKNDNQGIASANTGFFVGFKQGTLQYTDYTADSAISNLSIAINETNINNQDVWVQNVDADGQVLANWTKTDTTFGVSAIFSAIQNKIRTLYSVKTQDNDTISVNFGDGVFADVPRGILRIWYRTSLNNSYTLNTDDVGTVNFSFTYTASDNNEYTASFTAEMQEATNNSSSRESVTSIKTNSGRVFAAQDRMVTAQDYSVFPLTVGDNIRKIKSINRTHSGHSRFIDINDPTAQYQNVSIVADDGYVYSENTLNRTTLSLPTNLTEEQIFDQYISNLISNPETINLFYQKYSPVSVAFSSNTASFQWNKVGSSSGYITRNSIVERVGKSSSTAVKEIKLGSIVEFIESPYNSGSLGVTGTTLTITNGGSGYTSTPTVTFKGTGSGATANAVITAGSVTSITIINGGQGYTNPVTVEITGGGGTSASATATATSAEKIWARVTKITEDGLGIDDITGTPIGRDSAGAGAIVLNKPVPNAARVSRIFPAYNTQFSAGEKSAIVEQLTLKNTFGLRFDSDNSEWKVVTTNNVAPDSANSTTNYNTTYAGNTTGNNLDNSWIVKISYSSDRWVMVTRRFRIIFGSTSDVRFYNQNSNIKFDFETNKPARDKIRIFKTNSRSGNSPYSLGSDINFYGYKYYSERDGHSDDHKIIATISSLENDLYPDDPLAFQDLVGTDTVETKIITEYGFDYTVIDPTASTGTLSGRKDLVFQWKRIADSEQRIDPSISNIIDTYVLTNAYDLAYRNWLSNDRTEDGLPKPPTSDELKTQFSSIENKKSISDSLIYRSAKYKPLFGETADTSLQANFRVVKVAGTTLTDTEIKNRVLAAITSFFDIDNWEFGETFFFTELSAYVHNQLLGIMSSIVIVPIQEDSAFGNLFQVTPNSDEVFIPDIDLNSIKIVTSFTGANLRTSTVA